MHTWRTDRQAEEPIDRRNGGHINGWRNGWKEGEAQFGESICLSNDTNLAVSTFANLLLKDESVI